MNKIEKIIDVISKNAEVDSHSVSSKILYKIGRENGLTYKEINEIFMTPKSRVSRGRYDIHMSWRCFNVKGAAKKTAAKKTAAKPDNETSAEDIQTQVKQKVFIDTSEVYTPDVDYFYVPWGDYSTIEKIIKSESFLPTFISGLSGNGKTLMVEQACARLKREYVRIQISAETDESDLIGGFRLVNGDTVFYKGPVIKAMERGAIILIDELDRASNKILCLQGILEGKPVLLKKIGEVVEPKPGFNVIVTANTKGKGSDDGRFSGANIIDDAFMERFVATIDQPFPGLDTERKILKKYMEKYSVSDDDFVEKLITWAKIIRKTYEDGGVDELISTRRLCHIVLCYSVFANRSKAIQLAISRFDEDTHNSFLDLYSKIDDAETN